VIPQECATFLEGGTLTKENQLTGHRWADVVFTVTRIYTMSRKKKPQYSRHNFDKFKHSS